MSPSDFFSKEEQQEIVNAIKEAEKDTSGEIRVHIEEGIQGDVLDRAAYVFKHLKMHRTQNRNGVLYYFAIRNHAFAILGDAGINAVVPENFWDFIKDSMVGFFHAGNFKDGLIQGIRLTGEKLKRHFPFQIDDINELSDEISFGNELS